MSPLTPQTVRQLALIKYMYQEGEQQSRRPSPLFVSGLLSFQDAAELFLHLACGHHQVELKKRAEFLDYFAALEPVAQVRHRQGMDRLNRARASFKHHGNLPNDDDMEFFRVTTKSFFEENAPALFGVAFERISLADMVTCEKAGEHLRKAREAWALDKRRDAETQVALAFDALLADYRSRKRLNSYGPSLFGFGPSMDFVSGHRAGMGAPRLEEFIDKTKESIERLRDAVEILAFGLDYRKYARFSLLTPSLTYAAAGNYFTTHRAGPDLTAEEFEYCFGFVIESAVKLQEFDFTLPSGSMRRN